MQVWNLLHVDCWKCRTQKSPKLRHLGTIAQFCWTIYSQLRHVSTIGKKLVKQPYLVHTSSQYGELQPTSVWDLLASLGHPSKFQRVSRLGIARHSSSGREPNFVALNRGRHLYSAGRPSRWALAHILVLHYSTKFGSFRGALRKSGWICRRKKFTFAISSPEEFLVYSGKWRFLVSCLQILVRQAFSSF